ncbi:MAG: hypothetical protein D6685_05680 [Bacteroidetes bacterium]|nr:MAG: hypothetical protein D6685_05680 [Bacteroidota bacterium]
MVGAAWVDPDHRLAHPADLHAPGWHAGCQPVRARSEGTGDVSAGIGSSSPGACDSAVRFWAAPRAGRWVWRWLGGVILLVAGCSGSGSLEEPPPEPEGPPDGVALCHTTDGSAFVLQYARAEEVPAHLQHGDGIPTGAVPGQADYVFDAACAVVADTDAGPCPAGMAHVEGFCIDRWEAHLADQSPFAVPTAGVARTAPEVIPQGYISADVAERTCRAAGKRLCTSAEWLRACQGPSGTTYPYGDTYLPGACNEGRAVHPVVELFGEDADWSARQMNDPRLNQLPDGLAPTGTHPVCMSAEGVFDLHGNLHEWVADAGGTFRGGFYVDARINGAGCLYRTTAHGRAYHDYSTGFRCCADVQ